MNAYGQHFADVVSATVEVAAESGQAGVFTDEVARALTSVVGKVAAKAVDAAQVRGFVSGWQEAVETAQAADGKAVAAGAQVYRMPVWGNGHDSPDGRDA
ncbi:MULTISPECIES: hypothetical protein [Streptomyces]|uniref:WXG100 family type VII secretion target n=1 Tax=Streptomyces luteosporeus TaxID=173856 RepID=A0ABP6G4Y3_9ACTN